MKTLLFTLVLAIAIGFGSAASIKDELDKQLETLEKHQAHLKEVKDSYTKNGLDTFANAVDMYIINNMTEFKHQIAGLPDNATIENSKLFDFLLQLSFYENSYNSLIDPAALLESMKLRALFEASKLSLHIDSPPMTPLTPLQIRNYVIELIQHENGTEPSKNLEQYYYNVANVSTIYVSLQSILDEASIVLKDSIKKFNEQKQTEISNILQKFTIGITTFVKTLKDNSPINSLDRVQKVFDASNIFNPLNKSFFLALKEKQIECTLVGCRKAQPK